MDRLIREFRRAGFEAEVGETDAGGALVSDALELLREALLAIDHSLASARRRSRKVTGLEVELEEASWAVHRAILALMS